MMILKRFILKILEVLPDKWYLKLMFRRFCGCKLNLKNPQTFNEKLQRLKLYNRDPNYIKMVDKSLVKEYVANIIGENYIIPTLGVYDKFEDIDFDKLPNQFVLKCTHDSGSVFICKNKKQFDYEYVRNQVNKNLKKNFYYLNREWVYKYIKPRILVEKYMVDESGVELKDYKVFCFNGEPKMIQVDFDRFVLHKRNLYNTAWIPQNFEILYPSDYNRVIEKPICLDKMLELARKLSNNIPHIRVDFYVINKKIYFGELTFYHGAGYEEFRPNVWDYTFGSWIILPKLYK